jgi:hypothetical protein
MQYVQLMLSPALIVIGALAIGHAISVAGLDGGIGGLGSLALGIVSLIMGVVIRPETLVFNLPTTYFFMMIVGLMVTFMFLNPSLIFISAAAAALLIEYHLGFQAGMIGAVILGVLGQRFIRLLWIPPAADIGY